MGFRVTQTALSLLFHMILGFRAKGSEGMLYILSLEHIWVDSIRVVYGSKVGLGLGLLLDSNENRD